MNDKVVNELKSAPVFSAGRETGWARDAEPYKIEGFLVGLSIGATVVVFLSMIFLSAKFYVAVVALPIIFLCIMIAGRIALAWGAVIWALCVAFCKCVLRLLIICKHLLRRLG